MGTKCIWSPPTFATDCYFSLGTVGSRPDLLAKLKGRRKEEYGKEWVKRGWGSKGRQGLREGRRRKKGIGSPHVRSLSRGCACAR